MGAQAPNASDTSVNEEAATLTDEDDSSFDDLAADDTSWGDGTDDGSDDDVSEEADDSDQASDETGDDWDESDDNAADDESEADEADETSDDEKPAGEADDKKDPESEAEQARQKSAEDARHAAYLAREAKRNADKAAAQQEYLDGAEDEQDLAIRQLKVNAYNQTVEATTSKLTNSLDKAVASIPMFREGTDLQKQRLLNAVDVFEARFVQKDSNGDAIGILNDPATGLPADLVTYLQNEAGSIKQLAEEGAQRQVKDKTRQKRRTLSPGSRTPKKPKKDALDDGFDEEAARY